MFEFKAEDSNKNYKNIMSIIGKDLEDKITSFRTPEEKIIIKSCVSSMLFTDVSNHRHFPRLMNVIEEPKNQIMSIEKSFKELFLFHSELFNICAISIAQDSFSKIFDDKVMDDILSYLGIRGLIISGFDGRIKNSFLERIKEYTQQGKDQRKIEEIEISYKIKSGEYLDFFLFVSPEMKQINVEIVVSFSIIGTFYESVNGINQDQYDNLLAHLANHGAKIKVDRTLLTEEDEEKIEEFSRTIILG